MRHKPPVVEAPFHPKNVLIGWVSFKFQDDSQNLVFLIVFLNDSFQIQLYLLVSAELWVLN